jgi:hypothetical protein
MKPSRPVFYCHDWPSILRYIRLFYRVFGDREPAIHHTACDELAAIIQNAVLSDLKMALETTDKLRGFSSKPELFDDLKRGEGDNPTVGLILCAEKDEVVARYSILYESQQIFASKYMLYLPTEEELRKEIARERDQIRARQTSKKTDRKTET